jgi:hypothetical protein
MDDIIKIINNIYQSRGDRKEIVGTNHSDVTR